MKWSTDLTKTYLYNRMWCAAVLLFLLILIYFPNKPKLPPSLSAIEERMEFKTGVKSLVKYVIILCKNKIEVKIL